MTHIWIEKAKVDRALADLKYGLQYDSETMIARAVEQFEEAVIKASPNTHQQPKAEPVAWLCEPDEHGLYGLPLSEGTCKKCFPVYRHPQPKAEQEENKDDSCQSYWEKLARKRHAEILELRQKAEQDTPAYREAASLAKCLFKKHYAHEEHYASGKVVWGLCDTTAGVISQIDNMVCQLVRQEPKREWVGLTDGEKSNLWLESRAAIPRFHTYATLVDAKLKEKNTQSPIKWSDYESDGRIIKSYPDKDKT